MNTINIRWFKYIFDELDDGITKRLYNELVFFRENIITSRENNQDFKEEIYVLDSTYLHATDLFIKTK